MYGMAIFWQARYLTPLLWAACMSWLIFSLWDWREKKRIQYRQILRAAKGGGEREPERKDSRGLLRAVRMMDRGARMMHVGQAYWEQLDRKLALMGRKAGARETVTILLLRSLLVCLPALALPLLLEGWWNACLYLPAAGLVFHYKMKTLAREYAQWQKALMRDIPEVMDRLRICFAGGRDYLSALRQAQAAGGPAMSRAIGRLIHDIQSIGSAGAFRQFSAGFDLPAVQRLASALMLAVESGYDAAEAYFSSIEGELSALRQEAAESLVRTKPGKVYQLYALLFWLAVMALLLKGWEIFGQVGLLFGA